MNSLFLYYLSFVMMKCLYVSHALQPMCFSPLSLIKPGCSRFLSMKSNTKKNNIKLSLAPPSFVPHSFVPHYAPKNENQKKYVTYLQDPAVSIVLGVGPAGTGKTLFACNHAIRELKYGNIDKIVLTRPVVPVEEDLGFLPGNLVSKMDPWTRPLFDLFLEYYSKMELDSMLKSNIIEVSPLAYMRGRTFKRSFIIADEMQNCSPNQMFMITTRIGEQSKMVITGDLKQSDRGQENGLWDFLNKITPLKIQEQPLEINELQDTRFVNLRPLKNIGLVEFENTDIERSEIVRTIIELYNPEKKGNH